MHLLLDYIDVLAWPVVALTSVILFRRQLRLLLPRVSSVEALGAKVEFAESVEEILNDETVPAEERVETASELMNDWIRAEAAALRAASTALADNDLNRVGWNSWNSLSQAERKNLRMRLIASDDGPPHE